VQPADVPAGRCHWFAGIGGWEYALALAGWPDSEPVWTGSCPCQPFSSAGRNEGVLDERHLWPAFRRLIAERRPPVIFGEQVASRAGRAWLAGVRLDLEALGYAVGAADLCAASAGAPHIRQRLYWVADARSGLDNAFSNGWGTRWIDDGRNDGYIADAASGRLANPSGSGRRRWAPDARGQAVERAAAAGAGEDGGVGESIEQRWEGCRASVRAGPEHCVCGEPSATTGGARFWDAYDLIPCSDGKARRVEPGSFPLATGVPARVGRLRAYGNSIVPPLAAIFIRAFMEART